MRYRVALVCSICVVARTVTNGCYRDILLHLSPQDAERDVRFLLKEALSICRVAYAAVHSAATKTSIGSG